MALFASLAAPNYVALIDIGSASVTGSIAYSNSNGEVGILWSTQERILLKQLQSREDSGRHLMSALTNVFLELGQDGMQTLRNHDKQAQIEVLQVSLAAPWAYTITKQARYDKETPFTITPALYDDLLHSMEDKVTNELQEHEVSEHLGLRVVSQAVTSILANGYAIAAPRKQTASSLRLTLNNTVIQNYLYDTIKDVHNKVLPKTEMRICSFMLQLYYVLQTTHSEMQEYCIVNQTMEATEIGIVRENELVYSTHQPYGIVTLVRNLADIFAVPMDEIYGFIQSDDFSARYKKLSNTKQSEVDDVLSEYHKVIAELLQQTGDDFTLPKSIFIHTASCTYDFFATHVEIGASAATGMQHIVHSVDQELLKQHTGLTHDRSDKSCVELISAYYYHTHKAAARFIAR